MNGWRLNEVGVEIEANAGGACRTVITVHNFSIHLCTRASICIHWMHEMALPFRLNTINLENKV